MKRFRHFTALACLVLGYISFPAVAEDLSGETSRDDIAQQDNHLAFGGIDAERTRSIFVGMKDEGQTTAGEGDSRLAYRPSREPRTITCESQRGRYSYCRTHTEGRVRLERRLSNAPCRQYDTWGADGDGSGIWVADGCRAEFIVEPYRRPYPDDSGGRGRTVTCRSKGFEYKHCEVGGRYGRIRLERQLSNERCVRGDNWGVDRGGIWVDRGCAAEFYVE